MYNNSVCEKFIGCESDAVGAIAVGGGRTSEVNRVGCNTRDTQGKWSDFKVADQIRKAKAWSFRSLTDIPSVFSGEVFALLSLATFL